MANLPRGTVTFLFTDIEGSTRLWDAFADDMRRALSIHNELVGEVIAGHDGLVVKDTGDGLFAVFGSAPSAVAAAVEAQSVLAGANWPEVVGLLGVRMALHSATVEPTNGDYHGPDVNRAARIEAAGHGGQILLSSATHSLVAGNLPPRATLTDLGSHFLRGLSEPDRIYQVAVPGLRSAFPPLRTGSVIEAVLPSFPTSFVGRRNELAELADMILDPECRLVSLIGPGGIGKSRLAVEAAGRASERSGVAAHFLSLVGISDSARVVKALGDSIGFTFDIHISAQISEKAQLFDRLRAQPLILILDNLEHLPEVGGLISEMLQAISTLTILATTRRHLDLTADWRFEVEGLGDGDEADGVRLFVERAGQAGTAIDPVGPDRTSMVSLCELLGGSPLAIELAAAWSNLLSPSEIAEEIHRNLDFLEASARDVPERHRSMRAVFDHSWSQLPDDLQSTYARLAIFNAPFDRGVAEIVADASLQDLLHLAKQSLLSRPSLDRYALHPLLREFAREQLGSEEPGIADRYARFYWQFMIDRGPALQGSVDQIPVRDEVADELDHVRAVSDYWVDHFSDEEATKAILALGEFYFLHSWVDHQVHFAEIKQHFEDKLGVAAALDIEAYLWTVVSLAVTETSFSTPDEVAALLEPIEDPWRRRGGTGWSAWLMAKGIELAYRGEYEPSLEAYQDALRGAAGATPLYLGQLHAWYGWSQLQLGRVDEARSTFENGLRVVTDNEHYLGRAFLLSKAGLAADAAGDLDQAVQLHHEGREIFVKAGDQGGQGYTLSRLSWTHFLKGEYDLAKRYALEGLEKFEEINHRWGIAVSYGRLGLAEIGLGELGSAAEHFVACLDRATEAGLTEQQHYAITGVGRALLAAGRYHEAERLLRSETTEANPYREFAQAGLNEIPDDLRSGEAEETLDFPATLRLCREYAEELAESSR